MSPSPLKYGKLGSGRRTPFAFLSLVVTFIVSAPYVAESPEILETWLGMTNVAESLEIQETRLGKTEILIDSNN
jgi:hypothetical protein